MSNSNDLGQIIADGVMKAAAEIMRRRGVTSEERMDDLVPALRAEAKAALHEILELGRDAEGAAVSEAWIRAGVNAECVSAGKRAVDRVFGEA